MGISIKNLCVSFNDNEIYKNFNLEIEDGELVCILGKSACGKTILLNSILGHIKRNSGDIFVDDELIIAPNKKFGVVYQHSYILPWLSLRQNIILASSDINETDFNFYCHKFDVEQYLDMLPKEVSIGTKQRISIIRALIMKPKIFLMDEPLSAVDAITRLTILDILVHVFKNKTVLYVTHDIDEAIKIATRIIIIKKGGIIAYDNKNINIKRNDLLNII